MTSWFPSKGHPRWCQIFPILAGWDDFVWKIITYICLIILNHRTKKYNGACVLFTENSMISGKDLYWEFNVSSVKELHRFYSRFNLYKIQPFIPKMSQINSAHTSPYCLLNIYFNALNAELNPIYHLLILLGDLTFMGPYIVSISNKMQRHTVYLYL
jgi:hypothetical protein